MSYTPQQYAHPAGAVPLPAPLCGAPRHQRLRTRTRTRMMAGLILAAIWFLAVIGPSLAVTLRRLHDANFSGWMLLPGLIPFVGGIILLVFTVMEPRPEGQRFDPAGPQANTWQRYADPARTTNVKAPLLCGAFTLVGLPEGYRTHILSYNPFPRPSPGPRA
ncbi:DUF805 domain-containing protein [Arthrobacter sp. NicSoilB8]|uniref:DUF805 domain-containing protein n=1 Tax=Arthrobacter sp. NicSoilB8 TaxID=2830998 RepID=UPI001CC7825E|nr:DUF805 domain-containing protein [Arthrobacter sp. NicSoilB8]BCW71258.1 hypothetical protein NicSoilB8_23020 [Arthrobacter sp. NicSoilB8]